MMASGVLGWMSGSSFMCAGGNMPALTFDFWIGDLYLVNK